MSKVNILEDVATLTTIPTESLTKLATKFIYCINEAVEELVLSEDDSITLDVGFGSLEISIRDNKLKYYFEPSDKLNSSVVSTIKNKQNTLTTRLDAVLVDRILHTYKDLL